MNSHERTAIDEYIVEERLGLGGMAAVYRVHHNDVPELKYAIKILRADLAEDDTGRRRFAREARALAKVRHENVMQVVNLRLEQSPPYMVVELLPGDNLSTIIRRLPEPPSVVQSLRWIHQAACGLGAAHEQGIIHRDVKLSNLFLTEDNIVKVMDFGIALDVGSDETHLTSTGTLVGTPEFVPPEVAMGEDPDSRMDVYGLGVSLYALLVGDVPYKRPKGVMPGVAAQIVLRQAIEDGIPDPREEVPTVPEEAAKVVLACTTRDPDMRPRDGLEVAVLLEKALAALGDPVVGSRAVGTSDRKDTLTTAGDGTLAARTVDDDDVAARRQVRDSKHRGEQEQDSGTGVGALPFALTQQQKIGLGLVGIILIALVSYLLGTMGTPQERASEALSDGNIEAVLKMASANQEPVIEAALEFFEDAQDSQDKIELLIAYRVLVAIEADLPKLEQGDAQLLHQAWLELVNGLLAEGESVTELIDEAESIFPKMTGTAELTEFLVGNSIEGIRIVSPGVSSRLFAVDYTEVSVGAYLECTETGACPKAALEAVAESVAADPMVRVEDATAASFCAWKEGRLLTVSDWVTSASGAQSGTANCRDRAFVPVNKAGGASRYDVIGLVGNAGELVFDGSKPKMCGGHKGTGCREVGSAGACGPIMGRANLGFRCRYPK